MTRILQPYNLRVAHKPITNLMSRTKTNRRTDRKPYTITVYKIKCGDFKATYTGETGRNLTD